MFVKGKVLSRCRTGSKGTEILEAKTGGELGVICTIDVCIFGKVQVQVYSVIRSDMYGTKSITGNVSAEWENEWFRVINLVRIALFH